MRDRTFGGAMPRNEDSLRGLAFAVTAYVMWGFLPIYMKMLAHVPPVIAHRIIWSVPVAAAVLIVLARTSDLVVALRSPRMLAQGVLTAALISVNWLIYVWAIQADQTLDAALGYYINPLFSVLLGALVLGERMNRAQMLAVALAAVAVAVLTWQAGRLPLAALGLTFSWGLYAYLKKSLPIGPNQGFLLEVMLLLPLALGYVAWLTVTGQGHFGAGAAVDSWLLIGAGVVTAVPLIIYANGAKLLRLSTIGILQYIAPTLIFVVAVFVFGEPFGRGEMIAFPMIWLALVIYSVTLLQQARRSAALRAAERAATRPAG